MATGTSCGRMRTVTLGDGAGRRPAAALQAFKRPPAAAAAWQALRQCLDAMRGSLTAWPAAIDLAVQWYEPQLPRLHEHPVPRAADLAQLARLARGFVFAKAF